MIGIGVISYPKHQPDEQINATKSQVAGIYVSSQPGLKAGIGLSSSIVTSVADTTEDAIIEISNKPFGDMEIKING